MIRRSPTVDEARTGLMGLLEIGRSKQPAILDMQLRRLAALGVRRSSTGHELMRLIEDYSDILANPCGSGRSSPRS